MNILSHLPVLGLEPVGGEPLTSVTHGRCDLRSAVTFPAARYHRPLADTKLYCLVTEAHVCRNLPRTALDSAAAAKILTHDLMIVSPAY